MTDGDWDDDQPSWSPDGARLAFVSYREADADRTLRADIWTVAGDGASAPRKLTASDGSTIAFFATSEAERPFATQRLWAVRADGSGTPQIAAPEFDRDANSASISDQTLPGGTARPLWAADGRSLLFLVGDGGKSSLYRVAAEAGTPELVIGGDRALMAASCGAGGEGAIVFSATDGAHPAEVFAADAVGVGERRLTDLNGLFMVGKAIGVPERLRFPGGEGGEIDGWLLPPIERQEGEPYPPILMIHGGPHAQYGAAFFHEFQTLAARGYGVLYCNPHGRAVAARRSPRRWAVAEASANSPISWRGSITSWRAARLIRRDSVSAAGRMAVS